MGENSCSGTGLDDWSLNTWDSVSRVGWGVWNAASTSVGLFGVGKAFFNFLYGSVVSADLSVDERARLRIVLGSSTSSVLDVLALFLRELQ